MLRIQGLHVQADNRKILNGVNLVVHQGEVHALMGPNGSGKSTLALTLTGHPNYQVTQGKIIFKRKNILPLAPDERARRGLFLAFQYPVEVEGVRLFQLLRLSFQSVKKDQISISEFTARVKEKLELLKIDVKFLDRGVNQGFSGGEKKMAEILQMAVLAPAMAILDETDSGLDVDALKIVANGIKKAAQPSMGVLLITHYQRILRYIKPDYVHVMVNGRIVRSGGPELAKQLEEKGYGWLKNVNLKVQSAKPSPKRKT